MPDITFRTNDGSRWGSGKGSNLTATEVDLNFWFLYSNVEMLLTHSPTPTQISGFTVIGNQFYVNMDDHSTFGPFPLPIASWVFKGEWQPLTNYVENDIITNNGSTYLVLLAHESAATFDPGANDGHGHDFYTLMLAAASNTLNDLSDVTITSVADGDTLVRRSGFWVNAKNPFEWAVACSDEITEITTEVGKTTFRMPRAITLTEVRASLTVAQSSGSLFTVNVKRNGVSIFSTLLTIDNTEKTSVSALTPAVISTASLSDDDEMSVDVTVGDGTAKGLKITLIGYRP